MLLLSLFSSPYECDYGSDMTSASSDITTDLATDLTIEYFTSFKITTKNAAVWTHHLTAVRHLWYFICVYWYRCVAHFFSNELLDVSI